MATWIYKTAQNLFLDSTRPGETASWSMSGLINITSLNIMNPYLSNGTNEYRAQVDSICHFEYAEKFNNRYQTISAIVRATAQTPTSLWFRTSSGNYAIQYFDITDNSCSIGSTEIIADSCGMSILHAGITKLVPGTHAWFRIWATLDNSSMATVSAAPVNIHGAVNTFAPAMINQNILCHHAQLTMTTSSGPAGLTISSADTDAVLLHCVKKMGFKHGNNREILRASSGKGKITNHGNEWRATLEAEGLDSFDGLKINSWWAAGQTLMFFNEQPAVISSCGIVNKETPIELFSGNSMALCSGTIDLEMY